ncbi:hypothetical protein QOZ80_5BG0451290 [Eleusine coracana subsp. coracana]|nr:hypothetical protein QOZ80_5BG0451290 [Eleusine coracana subsp. coracana]
MDVPPVESEREIHTDSHPLLMEHVIGIPRDGVHSSSTSRQDNNDSLDQLPHVSESTSGTTAASNSQNAPPARNDNRGRRQQSPLNSGFWISVELVVNLSQIIAAICVLSVSRNEHPYAPLFEWVIGYTVDPPVSEAGGAPGTNGVSRNNLFTNPRVQAFVDHFKMALDCFFAVWFVVGNVWIFGGRSSAHVAPNLYRLCIAFLTFSCIGYAMPFILCALICCCLPCIISVMGFRDDLNQNRGATAEAINSLGTYKFKSKKGRTGEGNDGGGGVLAAGTDKERAVSAEDAVCCICLARYVDNDDLRMLPCAHFFHKDCVDKWLKINALCPLCKAEIDGVSTTPPTIGFARRHNDNRVGNDIESQQ